MDDADAVTLPTILGIKPKYYVGFCALAILALAFFLIFFLPGIVHPQGILAVSSEPQGAAVRVDGVTRGVTPCTLTVARGLRIIEILLPGFSSYTTEIAVSGKRFASLFAPQRITVFGALTTDSPRGAFMLSAAEAAAWSFAGEPTPSYQIPLALSTGAYRVGPYATNRETKERMNDILRGSLRFTVTKAGLRDILRAKFLIDNGGNAPSPLSLLHSAQDMLATLSDAPEALPWLNSLLPEDRVAELMESSWNLKITQGLPAYGQDLRPNPLPLLLRTIPSGGLDWEAVPGGIFIESTSYYRTVQVDTFWISRSEATWESWNQFCAELPQWAAENRAALEEQGLASADYLAFHGHASENAAQYQELPFSPLPEHAKAIGISWHAAMAYCQWLSAQLPADMQAAWEVRLPTEREWEYAQRLAQNHRIALSNSEPALWNWCCDPFSPAAFFEAPEDVIQGISSPERSVRGGAWINPAGSVSRYTRGSLPPETCSPFVSFKPVIALKRSGAYE